LIAKTDVGLFLYRPRVAESGVTRMVSGPVLAKDPSTCFYEHHQPVLHKQGIIGTHSNGWRSPGFIAPEELHPPAPSHFEEAVI